MEIQEAIRHNGIIPTVLLLLEVLSQEISEMGIHVQIPHNEIILLAPQLQETNREIWAIQTQEACNPEVCQRAMLHPEAQSKEMPVVEIHKEAEENQEAKEEDRKKQAENSRSTENYSVLFYL